MTSVSLEERVRKLERDNAAAKDILWTLFARLCRLENLMTRLGLLEVDAPEVRDDVLLQIEKRVTRLESGIAVIVGGLEPSLSKGLTQKKIDPPPVCSNVTNGNAKESRNPDTKISKAMKSGSTGGNLAGLAIERNRITSAELGAHLRSSEISSDKNLGDEDSNLCQRNCSHLCDGSHTWPSLCPPCKVLTDVKYKCGHEIPAICDLRDVLSQSGCGFCSGLKDEHLNKMRMKKLDPVSYLSTKLKAVYFNAFEEVMENVNRMDCQQIIAAIKKSAISDGSASIAKVLFCKIVVDHDPIEPSTTANLLKIMGSDSTSSCQKVFDELVGIASKRFRELFHIKSERNAGGRGNSSSSKMMECTRLIWLIGQLFCVDGLTFMQMMDIIDSLKNDDSSENIGHLCTLLELNGRKFHECIMSKNQNEFPTQYLCILWLGKVYEDLLRVSDEIVADPVILSRVQNLLHLERLRSKESNTLGEKTNYAFGKDVDLMRSTDSRTEDVTQISTESWEKQALPYSSQQRRNPSEDFHRTQIQENACQAIPTSPNKPSVITAKDLFTRRVQVFSCEGLQHFYRTYTTSKAKDRLECTNNMFLNLSKKDIDAFVMEYPYYFASMLEPGVVCDAVQFLRDVVQVKGVEDGTIARSIGRFITDIIESFGSTKKLKKFLFHIFAHEDIIDINQVVAHISYERMEDWQKLLSELGGKISSHLERKCAQKEGILGPWRAA